MKKLFSIFLLLFAIAQNYCQPPSKSEARKFIENAEITQINRNWNAAADFKSGLGDIVSFFPIEVIDLKSNRKIKSLQLDITLKYHENHNNFKSSWIDLNEVDEFIIFLEQYVIPNLKDKTEQNQSTTYIFNSKEIMFSFKIQNTSRRISIYLKDDGVIDYENYFWTETQVGKIPELFKMLKEIK